jgi:hypothetical protein
VRHGNAMYIFGGHNADGFMNELWSYSWDADAFKNTTGAHGTRTWTFYPNNSTIAGRVFHAASIYAGKIYIFGNTSSTSTQIEFIHRYIEFALCC